MFLNFFLILQSFFKSLVEQNLEKKYKIWIPNRTVAPLKVIENVIKNLILLYNVRKKIEESVKRNNFPTVRHKGFMAYLVNFI